MLHDTFGSNVFVIVFITNTPPGPLLFAKYTLFHLFQSPYAGLLHAIVAIVVIKVKEDWSTTLILLVVALHTYIFQSATTTHIGDTVTSIVFTTKDNLCILCSLLLSKLDI